MLSSRREKKKKESPMKKQIHWQEINQQMTIVRIRLEEREEKKTEEREIPSFSACC